MAKRSRSQRRQEEEESQSGSEAQSDSRQDRERVNSQIHSLVYNEECLKMYKEKFENREILATKYIKLNEVARMYQENGVETANFLATQGWIDFTKVNRPVCKYLLRVLMANLDGSTMSSWIGQRKIDLSEEAWCKTFSIPTVTEEEEASMMGIEREEVFYGLSGIHNLGVNHFIKIYQLHQEATMRLSTQIVNTILIPKKGSKEQIKFEESRLLYALVFNKKINLAKMIVSRLRAALGRKSSPITYGMHLMTLMEKAGVDLKCTEEKGKIISAPIDHYTLKRLGFNLQQGRWNYVGRGRLNISFPKKDQGKGKEEQHKGGEEGTQKATRDHPQTESSTPFKSTSQSLKSDISYLQSFLMEQLHLMQASLLSKLDSLDYRVQNLEEYLHLQPASSPHHSPPFNPSDPKGKRPLYSPPPSPPPEPSARISSPPPSPLHDPHTSSQCHLSPTASFYTPPISPHPESSTKPPSPPPKSSKPPPPPSQHPSPILIDSASSSSTSTSTSSSTAANRYTLVARPISTRLRSTNRRRRPLPPA